MLGHEGYVITSFQIAVRHVANTQSPAGLRSQADEDHEASRRDVDERTTCQEVPSESVAGEETEVEEAEGHKGGVRSSMSVHGGGVLGTHLLERLTLHEDHYGGTFPAFPEEDGEGAEAEVPS